MSEVSINGRAASLERRRALASSGKAALPSSTVSDSATQRRRASPPAKTSSNGASAVVPVVSTDRPETASFTPESAPPSRNGYANLSAHDIARARRASISRSGRGDAPAAGPTRPPRNGHGPDFAKVTVITEAEALRRPNGVRVERAGLVTGAARGLDQPISGTQYDDRAVKAHNGSVKVGFAHTPGGAIVSGSLVRSKVRITGDERGGAITVTGESEQLVDDDVTQRASDGAVAAVQFQRQVNPHGYTTPPNIARSVRSYGSREREPRQAVESHDGALMITGSATSTGMRVTGDEAGRGGATARKMSVSLTRTGRPVTGIDVEQHGRVSGGASGAWAAVTGSPYQSTGALEQRGDDAAPVVRVSGNIPANASTVTGTARGAARDISGTPYYRASEPDPQPLAEPVATIEERFSVHSLQRTAHLRSDRASQLENGARRITGSFAGGTGKVTGNLEFVFRPRRSADQSDNSARLQLTGEGRSAGRAITGEAWSKRSNVTGTEGDFAASRNPSQRAGRPVAFAGNTRFKALASSEEPKHLVTGMFGYSSDSAAKVTLSGGAQG